MYKSLGPWCGRIQAWKMDYSRRRTSSWISGTMACIPCRTPCLSWPKFGYFGSSGCYGFPCKAIQVQIGIWTKHHISSLFDIANERRHEGLRGASIDGWFAEIFWTILNICFIPWLKIWMHIVMDIIEKDDTLHEIWRSAATIAFSLYFFSKLIPLETDYTHQWECRLAVICPMQVRTHCYLSVTICNKWAIENTGRIVKARTMAPYFFYFFSDQ